jgi:hypothetical protein
MSARRLGSWQQFRAAVEEFHAEADGDGEDDATKNDPARDLPLYQQVRFGLQRLGHVEFSGAESAWRVVPPALSVVTEKRLKAIVCGARSPGIIDRLNKIGGDISWDVHEQSGMPTRIRLLANRIEDLESVAEAMGFFIQVNAPQALLAAIPPVDDPRSRIPMEPPAGAGWTVERFSPSSLKWSQVERTDLDKTRNGLFRFKMKYQRQYYLRYQWRTFTAPVQVGKFAVLRGKKRKLFMYSNRRNILSVPAICRPPLLIERALILCSGVLPMVDKSSGLIEYIQVPFEIVRAAMQLLRQEVQIYE